MEFTSPWDNHTVRMNNCNFATGKPSVLYALPALYGCEDYLSAVDPAEITLCADECVSKDELPGDEDLTELLHIILLENNWTMPHNAQSATHLYTNLRVKVRALLA